MRIARGDSDGETTQDRIIDTTGLGSVRRSGGSRRVAGCGAARVLGRLVAGLWLACGWLVAGLWLACGSGYFRQSAPIPLTWRLWSVYFNISKRQQQKREQDNGL